MIERPLLRHVLMDQREEFQKSLINTVSRDCFANNSHFRLQNKRALIVTGVRRCGKSTLALQLISKTPYVAINFDDERLVSFESKDFDLFLQVAHEIEPNLKALLLDEIQNIPAWELFVNRILRKGYQVFVTGSNAHLLSQELATHLTGRTESYELFPFSLSEFFRFHQYTVPKDQWRLPKNKAIALLLFEKYLREGGFPELVVGGFKANYLRELFDQLITKDIVSRFHLRQGRTLKELGLLLISQSGNLMSYQKIAQTLNLTSVNTAKRFVDYLEQSYLIFQLPNYAEKVREILKRPRKVYCIDPGLGQALNLKMDQDLGHRLESFVFIELKRRNQELFTWSDGDAEIDFVLREGREVKELIQVCYSIKQLETRQREIRAFQKSQKKLRCKKLTLLTFDEEEIILLDNGLKIHAMPAWRWALEAPDNFTID